MGNKYLPIYVSAKSYPILIVGGGKVALRKIDTLIEFSDNITVVAPELDDKIEYYATKGNLKVEKREYQPAEASKYGLVISASDDESLNREVYDDCMNAGVMVNVVDNPALCSFIFPAVLKREDLSIAISTDGKAPFLAAHLRIILENIFPDHWRKIVKLAGEFRRKVLDRWGGDEFVKERFNCLDQFLSADWKTLIKNKSDDELKQELELMLEPAESVDEEEESSESST